MQTLVRADPTCQNPPGEVGVSDPRIGISGYGTKRTFVFVATGTKVDLTPVRDAPTIERNMHISPAFSLNN